jgi:hypothetical protein
MTEARRLVGTGREGDFVHQTQQMGTEEGFKHVSKTWLDKCWTYGQTIQAIERNRAEIEDFKLPLKAFTPAITDEGKFVMRMRDGLDFTPTPFALRKHLAPLAGVSSWQVESLLNPVTDSKGNTVRERDERDFQVLCDLLNNGLRDRDPDKRHLFRTQKDGTLRAVLTDSYQIIDNVWYLHTLESIIPNGRMSHWRNDGDHSTMWGNILIPDSLREETDSDYGGMLSIGNSEIGRRKLRCTPSIFRAICMNGCIWDQVQGVAFVQVHRGERQTNTLRERLKISINKQIPLLGNAIDDLLKTRDIAWDGVSVKPLFAMFHHKHGLNKRATTDLLDCWREEANETPDLKKTAFAVINSVTRSGRKSEDPEVWAQRDELGGTLLNYDKKDWQRFFRGAKELKTKEVEEAYVCSNN